MMSQFGTLATTLEGLPPPFIMGLMKDYRSWIDKNIILNEKKRQYFINSKKAIIFSSYNLLRF